MPWWCELRSRGRTSLPLPLPFSASSLSVYFSVCTLAVFMPRLGEEERGTLGRRTRHEDGLVVVLWIPLKSLRLKSAPRRGPGDGLKANGEAG